MKKIILVAFLILSTSAFADMEHRTGQGEKPSAKRLSVARGCFDEIDTLGCGHPRDDHDVFIGCLDDKREDLSPNCQSFFERLYGKRK